MKILFAGYRSWATHAYTDLLFEHYVDVEFDYASTPEAFMKFASQYDYDAVVLAGWSWIVPTELCNKHLIIALHPSPLPAYRGGTPLQHQIMHGETMSTMTLFRLSSNGGIDNGDIVDCAELSLEGHMHEIFNRMSIATVHLLNRFIRAYLSGKVTYYPQADPHFRPFRRLKPCDSEITRDDLQTKTAEQLYNAIRCREDPYPNAFLKDETGTLIFKYVEFKKNVE